MMETVGFFLVPVACLDELRELLAYRRSAEEGWEGIVRENQYYRRARELAVFRVERITEPGSWSPLGIVMDELRYRAWRDQPDVLVVPEECLDRLRAMDAFEEHRGGRDRVIQSLVRDGFRRTEKAIREVYMILRSMLERAHREQAALVWAELYPTEDPAEAERLREEWLRVERERLEREGKLEPTPEFEIQWEDEDGEADQAPEMSDAECDRFFDEALWQIVAEGKTRDPKPPDPEYWPWEYPGLAVLPARCVEAVQAVYREAEDIYQTTGNIFTSTDRTHRADNLLMREAHDEEYFRCLGERGAWDVIAAEALGLEPRIRPPKDQGVKRMMFTVEETRAMADALERWSDALGGRDAAIEHMLARAYAPSRAMCERVYDAATRLLYTARTRGAVLAIIQCISD